MKTTPVENEALPCFDCYPEKLSKYLLAYSFETFADDNFRAPSKFFYRNAFGDAVFFKTHSRKKANEMLKELEGEGKYALRTVVRASVC